LTGMNWIDRTRPTPPANIDSGFDRDRGWWHSIRLLKFIDGDDRSVISGEGGFDLDFRIIRDRSHKPAPTDPYGWKIGFDYFCLYSNLGDY
jgi:hypothetical protein